MTVPGPHRPATESTGCPSKDVLEQFIEMTLSDDSNSMVREHVNSCNSCQLALDRLADSALHLNALQSNALQATLSNLHQSTVERLVKGLCEEWSNNDRGSKVHENPIPLTAAIDANSIGSLHHYQIRKEIASGGTATVFEATDTRTNERVAIKFIRRADEETLRRVQREIRAISAIQHDHVISIRSVEEAPDGRTFLVMPLAEGKPLSELIYSQSVGSFEQIVRVLLQVAAGLEEVHRCGLVHRDIKPSNIVVDEHGGARLTDFGLASFVDEESSLTESGMVVGTPAYMSPEQASGQKTVDARTDIYSLGATLYECFTETKPFRGQSHEVIRQIRESEPTRPSLINERIPRPLEAICLKAMSKSPSNRYATVGLLIDDLQRWQQGKRVTARLPGLWQRSVKWIRKDPKFSVAIASVACTFLIGVGVSGYYWNRSVQQSRLAESRFDASLQTINTLADLASQSLNGDPGLASIRKQIQVMADKAFEPLVGQKPSDSAGLIRYLKAMDNLGTIKHTVAGPSEALAFRKKMLDENRSVLASMRSNDELRRQWARMMQRLAVGHVEMRTYDEATKALDEAEALLSESDVKDRLLLGTIIHSRGTIHKWVNSDHHKAAEELNKAIGLLDSYCKAFPDDLLAVAQRNNSLTWLAECEIQTGNVESAEKHFQDAWAQYSALADSPSATYLQRLEKLRVAKALLSLMVSRGDGAEALRWEQLVGPEMVLLQASNPTLMEPAALKNSWGCDLLLAELLRGEFESAKTRADQLLAEAKALLQQFPNATRTWQAHGFAKQNWMVACAHVADYENLIPFIDEWINDVDREIEQGLNVGFNQQFRMGLIFNLALFLDWSGDAERAKTEWLKLMAIAPASMKPGFQLMSQIEPYRRARQNDNAYEFVLDEDFEKSVQAAISFYSGGGPYPSVKHSIAECHALALDVLKRTLPDSELNAQKIADHRSAAEQSLRTAHTARFYHFGERLLKVHRDPLFQEELFQAVFAE